MLKAVTGFFASHLSSNSEQHVANDEEEKEVENVVENTVENIVQEEDIVVSNNVVPEDITVSNNNLIACDGYSILNELPDEIILHIFSLLDSKHINNSLQFTNWKSQRLCSENLLWKKILRKTWHEKVVEKDYHNLNMRSYFILKSCLKSEAAIEWLMIPPNGMRPSKRYQNTSTTVGSKIYMIGGQESALVRFNEIFEFDPATYTFTRVAVRGSASSQPPNFARHIAVAIGSKIYVHGGFDGHGTYFGTSIFDVETSTWTYVDTKGDPPCHRTNHAAAAIGKDIYIYGGIMRSLSNQHLLEDLGDMFVLDTETLTWREERCVNIPPARCGHKMVSLRGKLYLFGGGAGEDWAEVYNDINVYDPETKIWTQVECTNPPNTSTFSCMFAIDPFIFVFGGQCKQARECSSIVYCYDTLTHTWHVAHPGKGKGNKAQPHLPDARDMATMSVCGHSAFLFGGYNNQAFDDVYFLQLSKGVNRALETLYTNNNEMAKEEEEDEYQK